VNVPRERLEKEFASLLEQVTPDRRYMRLFAEIVRRVWKQRQESSVAVLNAVTRRLRELSDRKNALVDFLLRGRLDQQTYDEQVLRLKAEIDAAEQDLRDADTEHVDVEAVLAFAERLVEYPHQLWLQSSLDQKQRLQRLFFPEGVSFTKAGFGTAVTHSFLDLLSGLADEKATLASPTGFEPVLSP
jgi:hypothetical protein